MQKFQLCEKKKQENIIASALLWTHDILNTNVLLRLDGEDIAFVASTNHLGKMWTIHTLASKCLQCDCPFTTEGIMCKHV
jgi:hypothetical protein